MAKVDYGKEVLKIFKVASGMSRRIAELEAEVRMLRGRLGLQDKALPPPSTKKPTLPPASGQPADVEAGPVVAGSKVRVVATRPKPRPPKGRAGQSSRYYGVSRVKETNRFKAQATANKKLKYLGTFDIEEVAALTVQEFLGNLSECSRLRRIIAANQSKEEESKVDIRHKEKAAAGLDSLKDESVKRLECKGCGETYDGVPPYGQCVKCSGAHFEQIEVLKDPQKFLTRPEGRHNN